MDSFAKNQRFIFGQCIAADALDILELLVDILSPASKWAGAKKKAGLW